MGTVCGVMNSGESRLVHYEMNDKQGHTGSGELGSSLVYAILIDLRRYLCYVYNTGYDARAKFSVVGLDK